MFAVVALVVLLVAGRVTQELEWSLIGIILLLVLSAAAVMNNARNLLFHPVRRTPLKDGLSKGKMG
jgi:hypothetical protein